MAQHYLAGLLKHLPDTHLIFRPTVNSYRRMDRGAWSPEDASWGYENRTAAVRAITTRLFDPAFKAHYLLSREAEQESYESWLANQIINFEWQRYFIGT